MSRTLLLRRPVRHLTLLAALLLGPALARHVAIGGTLLNPVIETKTLPSGLEGLPAWFLARLQVGVQNTPDALTLSYGARSLRYAPATGWVAQGFSSPGPLPAPEVYTFSQHVPLEVLRALGLPVLADTPEVLDFASTPATASTPPVTPPPGAAHAPTTALPPGAKPVPASPVQTPAAPSSGNKPATPTPTSPPASTVRPPASPTPPVSRPPTSPPVPATTVPAIPAPVQVPATPPSASPPTSSATLASVRSSRRVNRNMEYQRLVLEFSAPVTPQQARDKSGLTLTLPGATGTAQSSTLESGDTLAVNPQASGLGVRLNTSGGNSTVFTLRDPFRVVVDTVTNLDPSVPPPPDPAQLPPGVSERQLDKLHLVSFDPALYRPHVVGAPLGSALPLADLVGRAGGVAGVNGGYFDPASSLPVDLVALGGLMTAPSLERRATVGLDAQGGAVYGYPRPRYVLSGAWGDLTVNTVTARATPTLLTAFVGDGHTPVGGAGLFTLGLIGTLGVPGGTHVTRVQTGPLVPAAGELTLSFDPIRFPLLPQAVGASFTLSLNWRAPGWGTVQEAVAAGPLLVSDGHYALDPKREGFDTLAGVWRPTRQVAFGSFGGRPTIAYYEYGSPEDFARALAAAGVTDAVRMDSGTSATVFYAGGFLNTVWSRPVVNAIVMVPRAGPAPQLGTAP